MAGAGEIGKKLDFLLQEMQREANTLLSKTPGLGEDGLAITDLGLQIKAEIEKLQRTGAERRMTAPDPSAKNHHRLRTIGLRKIHSGREAAAAAGHDVCGFFHDASAARDGEPRKML